MKKDSLALGALILSSTTPATSFTPITTPASINKLNAFGKSKSDFDMGFGDMGFGFEKSFMQLSDEDKSNDNKNYQNKKSNQPASPSPEEIKKRNAEIIANRDDALIDAVSLSSAPSRNYGIFEEKLSEQGYFLSKDKDDKKGFKLTTPEGKSYAFKPLAQVEKKGFTARSMAVHNVNKDGSIESLPSSVRISFGRITPLPDIPKTFLKPSTGLPIEDKMSVKELIYKTRFNHYEKYSKPMYDKDVVVSSFSEDEKHGLYCFDECKKQGIETNLRRFNPNSPKIPTDLVFEHIMANHNERSLANTATSIINGNITNYKNENFQVFESNTEKGGILNNLFGRGNSRGLN